MNQQSLAEALFKRKWFNPFPKFKYTERPDTAAACLLEGKVVILVDNSPSAMILPTSILDMIEEANDYYFSDRDRRISENNKDSDNYRDGIFYASVSPFYAEPGMAPGSLFLCSSERYS